METETLVFDGFLSESSLSDEGRQADTIRNVLLCGLESKNGRSIPASAFGDSSRMKALYENCHVYLNHDAENGPSRKVQELAGTVVNVRPDQLGRPRGDVLLNDNNAGRELRNLVRFAERAKKTGAVLKDVGFSHVARYTFGGAGRLTVQSVDEVFSVDVVVRPATTTGFHESTASVPVKTPEQLLESLGVDLAKWESTPIEFAFNERAKFAADVSDELPEGFDPTTVLSELSGHAAEGEQALKGLEFLAD